jgi:cell division protein ZapA
MPQVEIRIGGRSFEVACQDGEEHYLRTAAALLDVEAQSLSAQIGRMPETRMLLMAGLLLADKTAGLEDRLREAEAQLADQAARGAPEPVRIEVPVVPREVTETLAELAARAEALAAAIEEKGRAARG